MPLCIYTITHADCNVDAAADRRSISLSLARSTRYTVYILVRSRPRNAIMRAYCHGNQSRLRPTTQLGLSRVAAFPALDMRLPLYTYTYIYIYVGDTRSRSRARACVFLWPLVRAAISAVSLSDLSVEIVGCPGFFQACFLLSFCVKEPLCVWVCLGAIFFIFRFRSTRPLLRFYLESVELACGSSGFSCSYGLSG